MAGFWHPLFSLGLGALVGVLVVVQRRLRNVAPLLVLTAMLMVAALKRVPLNWYPYTTAALLVMATAAMVSHLGLCPGQDASR